MNQGEAQSWLAATMRPYFTRELTRFVRTDHEIDAFWTRYDRDVQDAATWMASWPKPDDALTPLPEALRAQGWYSTHEQGTVQGTYMLHGTRGAVFTRTYPRMSTVVSAIARDDLYTYQRRPAPRGWIIVPLAERPEAHAAYHAHGSH